MYFDRQATAVPIIFNVLYQHCTSRNWYEGCTNGLQTSGRKSPTLGNKNKMSLFRSGEICMNRIVSFSLVGSNPGFGSSGGMMKSIRFLIASAAFAFLSTVISFGQATLGVVAGSVT